MYRQVFKSADRQTWFRSLNSHTDLLWLLGLLLASLVLFTIDLGNVPLRDWDEGIVAQVARNISREPLASLRWLYPTLAGEPYLNKPPLVHWLIACAYNIGGINEWTSRLPSALLTAFSVPLLYKIGLEIFPKRTPAIFSSLVYLTLLPVVRHGRLAMLDGPILCFFLLTILFVLMTRRDLRYGLGVGISLGLIFLTKGILGLLLGAIALSFLAWDTPRLLKSRYLGSGMILGMLPVALWYLAQFLQYGELFAKANLLEQSFSRIWQPVDNNSGPPWYYLLEILKYGWPWLLFLPQAYRLTWEHRNMSWAKLVLAWSSIYLVAISIVETKLPWYILPLYPAIALASGAALTEVWHRFGRSDRPETKRDALILPFLALLAFIGWGGFIYFGFLQATADWKLAIVLASIALTMTAAAVLAAKFDPQFLAILFWGTYVSLLLFVCSHHWVWELAEAYPVKPVARMIQNRTPPHQIVYTSYPFGRPSLNFYSDRLVIPTSNTQLQQLWDRDSPSYLLLDRAALTQLKLPNLKDLGTANGWTLILRDPNLVD